MRGVAVGQGIDDVPVIIRACRYGLVSLPTISSAFCFISGVMTMFFPEAVYFRYSGSLVL